MPVPLESRVRYLLVRGGTCLAYAALSVIWLRRLVAPLLDSGEDPTRPPSPLIGTGSLKADVVLVPLAVALSVAGLLVAMLSLLVPRRWLRPLLVAIPLYAALLLLALYFLPGTP